MEVINTENNENKPKKKSKLTMLGYIIGGLFIFGGVSFIFSKETGPLVGLGYLASGLVVFPPFWEFMKKKYDFVLSRPLKIMAFLVLMGITGGLLVQRADKYQEPKPTVEKITNVTSPTVKKEVKTTPKIVEEKPKVEPLDIAITSQIVKKVDGKCRYFFDVRNTDVNEFEGSVEIALMNSSGSTLGRETFNTNKPIQPSLGSTVYFDINTCPGGELGISDYSYKVMVGKDIVAEGKKSITSKYENLSY